MTVFFVVGIDRVVGWEVERRGPIATREDAIELRRLMLSSFRDIEWRVIAEES